MGVVALIGPMNGLPSWARVKIGATASLALIEVPAPWRTTKHSISKPGIEFSPLRATANRTAFSLLQPIGWPILNLCFTLVDGSIFHV
jgi:hypothetical protein